MQDSPSKTPKRGLIVGGLSGGQSLGANPALKEGPKDHNYEIVDGEAKARVYDTPVRHTHTHTHTLLFSCVRYPH